MKPRTLEEALKAMDEAELRVDLLRQALNGLWKTLHEAESAAQRAIDDFNDFTARHREERQ